MELSPSEATSAMPNSPLRLFTEPFLSQKHFYRMINRQQHEKTLTPAEHEASRIFAAVAKQALSEYEAAQLAFHANRERLKAERLARETASSKTSPLAIRD